MIADNPIPPHRRQLSDSEWCESLLAIVFQSLLAIALLLIVRGQ